jgi:hypothetical protein
VLVDAISRKNDLVPCLPPELLLQVFSYLPIEAPWSLQRVNKTWRDALSSDQILRAALLRLNTHDPSDSGRHADSIAKDSIHDRIRHMQSLKFGKPFSVVEFDNTGTGLQGPQPQLSHRRLDLKGKNIAYVSSKPGIGDAVILRDLESGSEHVYCGDARERILNVALSSEMMVFVTFDAHLYVVSLDKRERQTQRRLPSAHVRALGIDGSVTAIAMGETGSTHVKHLLIFNNALNTFQQVNIESLPKESGRNTRSLNSFSLLVNCRKGIIDLFTLAIWHVGPDRDLQIVQSRTHFDSNFIDWSVGTVHSMGKDEHVRTSHLTMAPAVPLGYRNQFRIQVAEIPLLGGLPMRLKGDQIFDTFDCSIDPDEAAEGFLEDVTREPQRWEVADSPKQNDARVKHGNLYAQWKGLALRATHDSAEGDWLEYYSLMNDTFLVSLEVSADRMQHSRIRVFCFDPRFNLHNGRNTELWNDGELLPKSRRSKCQRIIPRYCRQNSREGLAEDGENLVEDSEMFGRSTEDSDDSTHLRILLGRQHLERF